MRVKIETPADVALWMAIGIMLLALLTLILVT